MLRASLGFFRLPPAVIVGALVALAAKLLLASTTFGTTDVRLFQYFLLQVEGWGAATVYERVKYLNHPPSMIPVLQGIQGMAEATGLPFSFWLRLPAILADVGSLFLVASFLQAHRGSSGGPRSAALVLCAVAPVSILVSGFHGNTDPVMLFFVLLSIALLEGSPPASRSGPAWLAGAAMGMALCVKIVPLIFWPAIFLWLPGWRKRTEYFGAALLVVVAAWAPVFFASPEMVARRVFGYGSLYGIWGLSRILSAAGPLAAASELFRSYGRVLLLAAIVALPVWMNRGERRPALFRQIGVVAFAFLALTPGFGVQYLAWLVPFTALLPLAASVSFHVASGAFLFAVYTYWCQVPPGTPADPNWLGASFWSRGLPWNIADAHRIGTWRGELLLLEVACWLAVVVAFALQVRAAAAERARTARLS